MDQSYRHSGSERPFSEAENVQANGHGNANANPNVNLPMGGSVVEPPLAVGEGRVGRSGGELFLIGTFVLGLIGWLVAFISQAIVAGTISDAPVRILWFGFVIQTILIALIVEVILGSATYNAAYAYGTQVSILAALAAVFAVIGVDQNIYSPRAAQKATGAGWLIVAIVDVVWILYFTSPPQSPVFHIASAFSPSRNRHGHEEYVHGKVEKIGRSTDAFPMSAVNGSQRASANPSQRLQEGTQRKSGLPWSTYTPPPQQGVGQRATVTSVPSEARSTTHGQPGDEFEGQTISVRPDSGTAPPTAADTVYREPQPQPTQQPQGVPPLNIAEIERLAQWRAEAMFDYAGSRDDPNELKFKKGDTLFITNKDGKWWEGVTKDGRQGIAPSNYLRLL